MPWAPRHPCPGCGQLLPKGQARCQPCRAKLYRAQDAARPEHVAFYSSTAWKKLRAQVLEEVGACQTDCGRAAREVDHIIPRRVRPDLALERANLRAMCRPCHNGRRGETWRS